MLLFEFADGELKASNRGGKVYRRKSWVRKPKKGAAAAEADEADEGSGSGSGSTPTPEPASKTREKSHPPIKPVFTASAMTKMIDLRNAKFAEAVDELLVACAAQGHDPVELLLGATEDHVPVVPGTEDDEEMVESTTALASRQADLDFLIRNPEHRPSIASLIEELVSDDGYANQIVDNGHRVIEERHPLFGDLTTPLSDAVHEALRQTKGIDRLYSHQAAAINHLSSGKHVIVSTSTSSGKSLIYQLPAIAEFEADIASTCIYIYPTKALAQDQKRSLAELLAHIPDLVGVKVRPDRCRMTLTMADRDVRRRHAAGRSAVHPRQRQRHLHEPGHVRASDARRWLTVAGCT